jgi:type IV pilus assembly protein PilM
MPAYFGLDIGTSSIKVARVNGNKVSVGICANPLGKSFDKVSLSEKEVLIKAIKDLLSKSKMSTNKVVVGVPEALVFSKVMFFPIISSAELASAIRWQAEQEIPLPIDEVDLSWTVIDKPKRKTGMEKMSVLVVAMPKKASALLIDLLSSLGLEPVRAENETLALSRLFVVNKKIMERVAIVDIGSANTKMVLLENGLLQSVFASSNAGLAMSRALSVKFELSIADAEKYKRTYGLDKSQLEGKVFAGIESIVKGLVDELRRFSGSKPVTKIIIVGGGSFLKDLVPFLSENLGVEIVTGNVFEDLKLENSDQKLLSLVYGVAVGMAIEEKS